MLLYVVFGWAASIESIVSLQKILVSFGDECSLGRGGGDNVTLRKSKT